jgi:hypothetical protein
MSASAHIELESKIGTGEVNKKRWVAPAVTRLNFLNTANSGTDIRANDAPYLTESNNFES